MADPYEKTPKLIGPKREMPRLFLFLVLAIISAMMVLGTWAYSVL